MTHSRAQIIATLGPSSKDAMCIQKLAEAGADAFRLNFSWGKHNEHEAYIAAVKRARSETRKGLPIIQDVSGRRKQNGDGHGFDVTQEFILTDKDKRDIAFGMEQGVEYVALSYVGSGSEVHEARTYLKSVHSTARVIAKIERQSAVDDIDAIIDASSAVMIARGDLGKEVPVEQIPFIQQDIIKRARKAQKTVIVATQMLPSMIEHPEPTRSDVSDISEAITDGADVVMLSDETAAGKYPLEAVIVMEKVMIEAEKHVQHDIHGL